MKKIKVIVAVLVLTIAIVMFAGCDWFGTSVITYNLTYMNEGEVYRTTTISSYESISFPTEPEKDGYVFAGWQVNSDYTKAFIDFDDFTDEKNTEQTVYAKWLLEGTGTEGLLYSLNEDEDGYILDGIGSSVDSYVIIPDEYKGYPVIGVEDYAFYECNDIVGVRFSEDIESIGEYSFFKCSNLAKVTLPSSLTSIEQRGFAYCYKLKNIIIPKNVTSVGAYAFQTISYNMMYVAHSSRPNGWELNWTETGVIYWGTSPENMIVVDDVQYVVMDNVAIASQYIGEEVEREVEVKGTVSIEESSYDVVKIGEYACYYCDLITNISISDNVTTIGDYACYYCQSLPEIIISDNVTKIGDYAFNKAISAENIVIGENVASIGEAAFAGCNAISSITIPDSVTSIGDYAFQLCTMLESAIIGDSLTNISYSLFRYCYALKSIVIPNSVKSIDSRAFSNCDSLVSVTIGSGVTEIFACAFTNSDSLTSVVFADTSTWYYKIYGDFKSGSYIQVSSSSTAAKYLTSTYDSYYWYKE